jgi:hypothetical protein
MAGTTSSRLNSMKLLQDRVVGILDRLSPACNTDLDRNFKPKKHKAKHYNTKAVTIDKGAESKQNDQQNDHYNTKAAGHVQPCHAT